MVAWCRHSGHARVAGHRPLAPAALPASPPVGTSGEAVARPCGDAVKLGRLYAPRAQFVELAAALPDDFTDALLALQQRLKQPATPRKLAEREAQARPAPATPIAAPHTRFLPRTHGLHLPTPSSDRPGCRAPRYSARGEAAGIVCCRPVWENLEASGCAAATSSRSASATSVMANCLQSVSLAGKHSISPRNPTPGVSMIGTLSRPLV